MPSRPLHRRTVLRGMLAGAAVGIGLPTLEIMLRSDGRAFADGSELPTRFGVWFWGNGVRPEQWVPSGTGSSFTWSPLLQAMEPLTPYVSIITGLDVKTATHPHHSGMTGVLTGDKYHKLADVRDTIATTFARPSVDQLIASEWDGQAPYRSLEVGVTRFRGTDEGSTFQHVSHNGPNDPNPSEYSAETLYRRLFGGPGGPQMDLARLSVLDAVQDQIHDLDRRLGAGDRVRLDRHLTSVRELERRLEESSPECSVPIPPRDPVDGANEPIAEKNSVMSDLLAVALACDLTRVFTVQFSAAGAGVVFWQVGATNSLHYTCHTENMPQPIVAGATRVTMEQLAHFLQILRDREEGDGNLLDNCSILCTSELADGRTHSNAEFPLLIAGKGGGRLKGGIHARVPGASVTRGVLTAMQGAGSGVTSFGHGPGYTDRPITDLLT